MSGTVAGSVNGTYVISGPKVIQLSDVFVKPGILHPITVGAAATLALFIYLRLGSNRCIAPINIFDWVINVALGSTLAGIVNGASLVRGLLALATMLWFQWLTSTLATRFNEKLAWIFQSHPLVIAFHGKMLVDVMKKHRISPTDVNAALRQNGILNICQVETAIIEPNGTISIFTMKQVEEAKVDPDVLMAVPAYRALYEGWSEVMKTKEGTKVDGDVEKGMLGGLKPAVL